nr:hypothetical protein [Tanacetum cinerariifolium]
MGCYSKHEFDYNTKKKDKIESKPEKNRNRGEAGKSQKQLQSVEKGKLKKTQKEGPEMQTHASFIRRKKLRGLNLQFKERYKRGTKAAKQSGNPTFSLHKEITSPEVTHEIHDSKGCNFLSEELPYIDFFNDIHPHFDDDSLSGSTTYSANSLHEEFTDELALITYPSGYDDNLTCDIESDLREIEFLLYQGEYFDFKDSNDQTDLTNLVDLFVDPIPEMFTDEQPPDYSFPPRFDVYPDDFL